MQKPDITVESLGELTVINGQGELVKLSSLWKTRTAVLVFVRHFGWVFCRQQVAELAENVNRFKEKNANLAVIGSGDPEHFKAFREKTRYDGLLFSDPSLAAFSLLGFTGGITGMMSVRSVFKAVSAFRQGHRQGTVQGSTLQLGGAIVIDVSGAVRYYFASAKAGDHPAVDELIRALDRSLNRTG